MISNVIKYLHSKYIFSFAHVVVPAIMNSSIIIQEILVIRTYENEVQ